MLTEKYIGRHTDFDSGVMLDPSRQRPYTGDNALIARPQVGQPAMEITVNEESRDVKPGTTVAELLGQLSMQPRQVAVERNLQIVPRAEHADCVLEPGDRLEIVTLVGGG